MLTLPSMTQRHGRCGKSLPGLPEDCQKWIVPRKLWRPWMRQKPITATVDPERLRLGGLSVTLRPAVQLRRHDAGDPLFGIRRRDQRLGLDLRVLLHRSLRYGGFAPYIGYSFEQNRSSIPIHSYRNHGVLFGVSRTL